MNHAKRYLLHEAIANGEVVHVKELLAKKQEMNKLSKYVNRFDKNGNTPLQILTAHYQGKINASNKKIITIASCLLEAGANPNKNIIPNQDLPLFDAIRYGNIALIRLLLNYHADVNRHGEEGHTPLSLALTMGHHDIVRLLLINKADPTLPENSKDETIPLERAILYAWDYEDASLKYLLSHPAINLNEKKTYEKVLESFIFNATMKCLESRTDEEVYSEIKFNLIKIARILILGGFNFPDTAYFFNATNKENPFIRNFQEEGEFELNLLRPDKTTYAQLLKEEIYPLITKAIAQAEEFKTTEQARISAIQNPQIIKQFLLASAQEKSRIIEHIKQLESVLGYTDNTITTRFLFSSLPAQEEFRQYVQYLNYIKNNITDYSSELIKSSPLLAAALTFPPEVFQIVLQFLLTDPYKLFISIEESPLPVEQVKRTIESFSSLRIA
jgi:hypothetical protein